MKDKENDLGAVSATEVDAVPCSVPTPELPHADLVSHALMLDGLATLYQNEASIGPKSKARYAQINADACKAGSDAIRQLVSVGGEFSREQWRHHAYSVRCLESAAHSDVDQMLRLADVLESAPNYATCEAQWLRAIAARIRNSEQP